MEYSRISSNNNALFEAFFLHSQQINANFCMTKCRFLWDEVWKNKSSRRKANTKCLLFYCGLAGLAVQCNGINAHLVQISGGHARTHITSRYAHTDSLFISICVVLCTHMSFGWLNFSGLGCFCIRFVFFCSWKMVVLRSSVLSIQVHFFSASIIFHSS